MYIAVGCDVCIYLVKQISARMARIGVCISVE